jgi:hypothetical protein
MLLMLEVKSGIHNFYEAEERGRNLRRAVDFELHGARRDDHAIAAYCFRR